MALVASPNYRQAARKFAVQAGIDPGIFTRQIWQESKFDPAARSGAGAIGIAQIVPKWHPGVNPLDPMQSLEWAANWDATLLKKHKGDWRPVLSTYNSGQPDKYLDPSFAKGQTFNYVRSILGADYKPTVLAANKAGSVGTVPTPNGKMPFVVEGRTTANAAAALKLAQKYLGTPYVYGGETPGEGFDCSGLLQYVWGQQGVQIPRRTYEQYTSGQIVPSNKLMPGDAVFFTGSDPLNGLPGHVGMYIGGGKFIESPHTGASIRISNMAGRNDFVGARRYTSGPATVDLGGPTGVTASGGTAANPGGLTAAASQANVPFNPTVVYNASQSAKQVLPGGTSLKPAGKKAAAPNSQVEKQIAALLNAVLHPKPTPSFGAQATSYANQAITAALAPLLAAQQRERDLAASRAEQIKQAAAASAEYLTPLADQTRADYKTALDAQNQAASAFSGGLRDVAMRDTQAAQAALASVPGNEQVLPDYSQQFGNMLQGTQGLLPATSLGSAGIAAIARANTYPAGERAYGQQQANLAVQAGDTAASQYAPSITGAAAQFPVLQQQYMNTLSTQAATARQNDIENAMNLIKLYQSTIGKTAAGQRPMNVPGVGLVTFDAAGNPHVAIKTPAKKQPAQIKSIPGYGTIMTKPNGDIVRLGGPEQKFTQSGGNIFRINSDGTLTQVVTAPTKATTGKLYTVGGSLVDADGNIIYQAPAADGAASHPPFNVAGKGRMEWDSAAGKYTLIPGSKPVGTGTKGKFNYIKEKQDLQQLLIGWSKGAQPEWVRNEDVEIGQPGDWVQKPGTGNPPVSYRQAIRMALDAGPDLNTKLGKKWARDVRFMVNGVYQIPDTLKEQITKVQQYYRAWRATGGKTPDGQYVPIEALFESMYQKGYDIPAILKVLPAGVLSRAEINRLTGRPGAKPGLVAGTAWNPKADPLDPTAATHGEGIYMTESGRYVDINTRKYVAGRNG